MLWRDINSLFGDQKTPEGEINSIIGGSTAGIATQTPTTQDNSTAQTGVVKNSDANLVPKSTQVPNTVAPMSPSKSTITPSNDLLGNPAVNLNEVFKKESFLQPAGMDSSGELLLNKTVVWYPDINDSAVKVIQAGIPTSKGAQSGIGLPKDLSMGESDLNSAMKLINRYLPDYSAINSDAGTSLKSQIDTMLATYNQAKASGNASATSEALAKLKLTIGSASNTIAWYLSGKSKSGTASMMEEEDEQVLWNTKTKAQDFLTYYNTSGKDLNTYLQQALTPDSTTLQVRASDEGSRIAKQDMLTNPFYAQFLEQAKYVNPLAYDKLITDATSDTITSYEKKFIQSFKDTIDKIYQQRKSYASKYGWTEANNAFSWYDKLFELNELQYKSYMDDIMDSMYAGIQSSAQTLLSDFTSPLFR